MNVPKRHHYVPQMLLKRFSDSQSRLFVFNKNLKERGILHLSPRDVFVKKHLYAQHLGDGSRDYSIEKELSVTEGKADRIIRRILCSVQSNRLPNLTAQEKKDWDRFFCSLWIRTPDVHQPEGTIEDRFRRVGNTVFNNDQAKVEALLQDRDTIRKMEQNITANLALPERANLSQFNDIVNKGLRIAVIRKARKSLVIGSRPVVFIAFPYLTNFSDLSANPWLPIAPNVAITPALVPGKEEIVEISHNQSVRWMNNVILSQSTSIAGNSRELIRSLSG